MFRSHALAGASTLVLSWLFIPHPAARAQDAQAQPQVLPATRVVAPKLHRPKPSLPKQSAPRQAAPTPAAVATPATPGAESAASATAARQSLNQAPAGQTETTIDRGQYDNRPSFSVGDVLHDSPGISIKQGNGPRDVGISIRGSNARNTFGIRNIVIFDDGFPVTQPDGLSRSDLIDPHAYGAIDVIRGPSSALYGNYATGGALNFRTRPGGEIDGLEYGAEGGSFGYLNNYLAAGKKVGNFEGSLFASDVRGDGFISNSWYNTQTVNFLGTLKATWDDRFTIKFINNDLSTRLPIRLSLNQYYENPFQQGCVTGATAALGCGTVTLFNNGFNKSAGTDVETALQAGLGRDDRRTIVGGRWDHDFDNQTTWRNQFVFDDRNINQPTGTTSAIGDFPSYNYISDITRRGELFGLNSTTYFGGFYNTMSWSSDTFNVMPGGNATLGSLAASQTAEHTNYGLRAREEINVTPAAKLIAGFGWEISNLKGVNTAYTYTGPTGIVSAALTSADRQFENTAPELALLYKVNSEWQLRARVAGGYGTPQIGNLFVLPNGQFGNNTQLSSQRNLGYDLGVDWMPNNAVKLSLTGFYEFFGMNWCRKPPPPGRPIRAIRSTLRDPNIAA